MMPFFQIVENSRTPKYMQIANNLIEGINSQRLPDEGQLPSINYLCSTCSVSKDTVVKAYNLLMKRKLVEAIPGKGYFVREGQRDGSLRIFLLFNKLSAHKKIIYDHFTEKLQGLAEIDFRVYNNDFTIFRKLLSSADDHYSHYVIIPHFYTQFCNARDIINRIPKHKLLILDKKVEGITGEYACVYQDFEQDIYRALVQARPLLQKYRTLKLLFPAQTYQPREIIKGFQKFTIEHRLQGKLVSRIEEEPIAAGEAYITMMEDGLVTLVKKIKQTGLKVGREVGILSYNESPLKEVLLDGITVVSTDFRKLGEAAAGMILTGRKEHVENPFRLIVRKSL